MKPVLELTTQPKAPVFVSIDGKSYRMRRVPEFDLFQFKRYERIGEQLRQIEEIAQPTKAQEAEYSKLMRELCSLVVQAPASVHAKLTDIQRAIVLRAQLRSTMLQAPAKAKARKP